MVNLGVLGVFTVATVLRPCWISDLSAWLCRRASRWFVVGTLGTAVVAVYLWVYLEGCRNGWWAVLAAELADRMAAF